MIDLKPRLENIALGAIEVGERFRKDYGDLSEMIQSFKEEGVIQPLAVMDKDNGTYLLLAGGRRHAAATKSALETVPCRIYANGLSELQIRSIELMENLVRKDMKWDEAAELKTKIYDLQVAMYGKKNTSSPNDTGVRMADVAEMMGVSTARLSKDITLMKALETFPELRKEKTRDDAEKKLNKLKETMIQEEIARRLSSKLATTPVEIIRQNLCSKYIVGDFFDTVKQLPTGSVDFCEIDPPYGIDLKKVKQNYDNNYQDEDYNEVPAEEYVPFMYNVLFECYRVMTENAWLVLWFGPEPWHETMWELLVKAGFETTRITGMWYKGQSGQTMQQDTHLANSYESFYYARKGKPNILRPGRSNVFHFKPVPPANKIHPTERPIEMIQDMIQTFCWEGSRILVPFAGSGNTLLAAANLGMTAIGCDKTKAYKDAFTVRVHDSMPPRYKSYKEEAT